MKKNEFKKVINYFEDYQQEAAPLYNKEAYKKMMLRVVHAVLSKHNIHVLGDFDADGICSATALHRYLLHLHHIAHGSNADNSHITIDIVDPREGFGLSPERFNAFVKKETDLMITTDHGSDSEVVVPGNKNLIVLDHHPSRNYQPYVINPNAGRTDDTEFSTSGGFVVWEFIRNIDLNIYAGKIPILENYKEERSVDFLKALKAICAITIVSDMAKLDKRNREFFIDAIETGCFDANLTYSFETISGLTMRDMSFSIISTLNSLNRTIGASDNVAKSYIIRAYGDSNASLSMKIAVDWLAPPSREVFDPLNTMFTKINETKKTLVRRGVDEIESRIDIDNADFVVYGYENMLPRLCGLIANRVSSYGGNIPTIIATVTPQKTISFSARGKSVKQLIDKAIIADRDNDLFSISYGGHNDACGGVITPHSERVSLHDIMEYTSSRLRNIFGDFYKEAPRTEIVSPVPVSVSAFKTLSDMYSEECNGADYAKRFYIPVSGHTQNGITVYGSGWANVSITDGVSDVTFGLFMAKESIESKILNDNTILLFELTSNGDISFVKSFENADSFYSSVKVMDEVVSIMGKDTVEKRISQFIASNQKATVKKEMTGRVELMGTAEIINLIKDKESDSYCIVVGNEYVDLFGVPFGEDEEERQLRYIDTEGDEPEQMRSTAASTLYHARKMLDSGMRIVFHRDGIGTSNNLKGRDEQLFSIIHSVVSEEFSLPEYGKILNVGVNPYSSSGKGKTKGGAR